MRPASLASARSLVLLAATLIALLAAAPGASGAQSYASGSYGYDISWPQCITTTPAGSYAFAIVGVTGGRAFTENPCLARQYSWADAATGGAVPVSVYMNIHYASARTASHGWYGPYGSGCRFDTICFAENFGWNAARKAYLYALWARLGPSWQPDTQATGASPALRARTHWQRFRMPAAMLVRARAGGTSLTSPVWWLDVEVDNTWSDQAYLNRAVIQGASAFLTGQTINGYSSGVRVIVGIYSVASMWNHITGGWSIPGVPIWVAGAPSSGPARHCIPSNAFGNGTIWLVQYLANGFDGDYAC